MTDSDLDRDRIEEYYDLGCQCEDQEDYQAARGYYEKVFAIDPFYEDIRDRLSELRIIESFERKQFLNKYLKLENKFHSLWVEFKSKTKETLFHRNTYIILVCILPILILTFYEKPMRVVASPLALLLHIAIAFVAYIITAFVLIRGIAIGQAYVYLRNLDASWIKKIPIGIKKAFRSWQSMGGQLSQESETSKRIYQFLLLLLFLILMVITGTVITFIWRHIQWQDMTLGNLAWKAYSVTVALCFFQRLRRIHHITHMSAGKKTFILVVLNEAIVWGLLYLPLLYHWHNRGLSIRAIVLISIILVSCLATIYSALICYDFNAILTWKSAFKTSIHFMVPSILLGTTVLLAVPSKNFSVGIIYFLILSIIILLGLFTFFVASFCYTHIFFTSNTYNNMIYTSFFPLSRRQNHTEDFFKSLDLLSSDFSNSEIQNTPLTKNLKHVPLLFPIKQERILCRTLKILMCNYHEFPDMAMPRYQLRLKLLSRDLQKYFNPKYRYSCFDPKHYACGLLWAALGLRAADVEKVEAEQWLEEAITILWPYQTQTLQVVLVNCILELSYLWYKKGDLEKSNQLLEKIMAIKTQPRQRLRVIQAFMLLKLTRGDSEQIEDVARQAYELRKICLDDISGEENIFRLFVLENVITQLWDEVIDAISLTADVLLTKSSEGSDSLTQSLYRSRAVNLLMLLKTKGEYDLKTTASRATQAVIERREQFAANLVETELKQTNTSHFSYLSQLRQNIKEAYLLERQGKAESSIKVYQETLYNLAQLWINQSYTNYFIAHSEFDLTLQKEILIGLADSLQANEWHRLKAYLDREVKPDIEKGFYSWLTPINWAEIYDGCPWLHPESISFDEVTPSKTWQAPKTVSHIEAVIAVHYGIYATLMAALGHQDEAVVASQKSIALSRKLHDRELVKEQLYYCGKALQRLEHWTDAYAYYQEAKDLAEGMRHSLRGSEARLDFTNVNIDIYYKLIEVSLAQNNQEETFRNIGQAKARALIDLLHHSKSRPNVIHTNDPDLDEERILSDQLEESLGILAQYDTPLISGIRITGDTANAHREVAEQYFDLTAQHRKVIDRLRHKYPQFSNAQYAFSIEKDEVKHLLEEDEAFIEYFVLMDELICFYVDAQGTFMFQQSLREFEQAGFKGDQTGADKLWESIREFRHTITQSGHPDYIEEEIEFGRTADQAVIDKSAPFYELLFAPIEDYIHNRGNRPHSLTLSPHGALHLFPFHMLHTGDKYLLEQYEICYIPNASLLKYCRNQHTDTVANALVLGNPAQTNDDIPPLPYSEDEALSVSKIYDTTPYLGREATETLVRTSAADKNIIHFACHGDFNTHHPAFSALLLCPDDKHNGRLTVREIMEEIQLTQGALVVLSACDLGLGEITLGDDLLGMIRAFFYAGATGVVASLWKLNDQSGAYIMDHFHQNLKSGQSRRQALREAQLAILNRGKTEKHFRHPYYWAPFVLVG